MPLARRVVDVDAELGKKFDDSYEKADHYVPKKAPFTLPWGIRRRRRVLLLLVGAYLLYLFFKNMPTDLRPAAERYDPRFANSVPVQTPLQEDDELADEENEEYDGPLQFPELAQSLFRVRTLTKGTDNSVIFAAADLSSVSDLIPVACEMARYQENTVHFALMGREQVSIEGIQRVNGISAGDCPIFWHDARLDYPSSSTEGRLEEGVSYGVEYIVTFLRPKVIIAHDEQFEESYFQIGVEDAANRLGVPLVSLSTKAMSVMWISRLDSNSLQAWNDVHVDMLVHAPLDSSGSLVRLLDSLAQADYLDSRPSLTIELPSQTDPHLLDYVRRLSSNPKSPFSITLRRRVSYNLTPEQAAIRTVETFYPKDPASSHLLFLSPQAELSPSFYHYLKYTTLKFRHSVNGKVESSHLLGISLELPARKPTDDALLSVPSITDIPFFKWQIPNSNAALYFGDKWEELHNLLTYRLAVSGPHSIERNKFISKKYPPIMEDLLELMRAKGYYMLYPSFPATQGYSLATIHNDLYQPPEEFQSQNVPSDQKWNDADLIDTLNENLPLDLGSIERPLTRHATINLLLQQLSLQVPNLETLPLLSYRGEVISSKEFAASTKKFASEFSMAVGGCDGVPDRVQHDEIYTIEDIYCLGDR